jgi:guanine deaminase
MFSMINNFDIFCLEKANILAEASIKSFGFTPFGAVVALEDRIVGAGCSSVVVDHDPTHHAEVNALSLASKNTNNHLMEGGTLYVNGFPCPLCLTAAKWARISKIVIATGLDANDDAGFEDSMFYRELGWKDGDGFGIEIETLDQSHEVAKKASFIVREWGRLARAKELPTERTLTAESLIYKNIYNS